MRTISTSLKTPGLKSLAQLAAVLAGALALSACAAEEETTYEADVEDASGGELVVVPEDAEGVEVELPEAPMTPEAVEDDAMEDEAAAE